MRRIFRTAAVALLLTPLAAAQEATVPVPQDVTLEGVPPIPQAIADGLSRYANFTSAQLLAWHPTKRQIIITSRLGDVQQLYTVDTPGKAPVPLAPDTVSPSVWAQYDPANPSTVLFVKDAGTGGEAYNLFRLDPAAGTSTLLTDGKSRYAAPPLGTPVWARSGKWIAYDSTERNGRDRDLWVMQPGDPSTAKRLGEFDGIWVAQDWSPDGNYLLALNLISSGSVHTLWRIDVRSGERKALAPLDENVVWDNARYSSDGKTIYAISTRGSGVGRIWRSDAAGVWLPVTGDRDEITAFEISPDGLMAGLIVDRGDTDQLQVIDLGTRKPRRMPDLPPGMLSHLAWRPGSRELGFTQQNLRTYGDVFSVDTSLATLTRWTKSPSGGFDTDTLPAPQIVSWKSFDGRTITGIYYRAASKFSGPRPVMINIHGGPMFSARPTFVGRSNYFLNELGVSIIYPNVRGSVGFGPEFAAADDGKKREGAIRDIGALLDWIASRPELDKTRVMLTGASYGGYLALEAGARYNDRIRCIYEGVGQTNLVTYLEQTEPSRQDDRRKEFGDERDPDMRAFLLSISPVSHASLLRKPTGIVHPANDTRVPVSQARELITALKGNNAPVWYMEYQNAGHDTFPRNRTDDNFNWACWVQFVKTYLLK